MSKSIKHLIVTAVLVLCLAVSVFAVNTAKAENTTSIAIEGASVSLKENQKTSGIRFSSKVTNLPADATVGTIVVPSATLTGELTHNTANVLDIVSDPAELDEKTNKFNSVVYNIPVYGYNTMLTARSYYKVGDKYTYSAPIERSISQVSQKAILANEQDANKVLYTYVNDAYNYDFSQERFKLAVLPSNANFDGIALNVNDKADVYFGSLKDINTIIINAKGTGKIAVNGVEQSLSLTAEYANYEISATSLDKITLTGDVSVKTIKTIRNFTGLDTSMLTNRDGCAMPEMINTNDGVVLTTNGAHAGAKVLVNSILMDTFHRLKADQGMKITVTNNGDRTIQTRFFFNDQLNTNAQILELESNGVGTIYFRNDGEYVQGDNFLDFWIDIPSTITVKVEFITEKDYEVKLFDEANKGAEIAAAMSTNPEGNAPKVTFENGKFTIDALAEDRYVNLLALGNYSDILSRFYANITLAQRRQQVIAVDVQLVSGASDVWFGAGLDRNCINDDTSRIQKMYTDKTRTIYIPLGLLSRSSSNYTNSQVEGNFAWVKLDVYKSKIVASNFRVLNFAGIELALNQSVTTNEFANYVVPAYDNIFVNEKAHTASVVNVEYSEIENGAFNTVKATTLNKVGFYKVTYKVDYNDETSSEAILTVKVLKGLSADKLNNDAGKKDNYVVNGQYQGVMLTNIETAFGGGAVSNADFINRFNSMTDKEVLKVTVKNIGKYAYGKTCFFFDNTNTESLNFRASLNPGESTELFIKRNMYSQNVQAFKFWLDGPSAKTPFDIAIDFNFYNDTTNELTQYNVLDYKTLFADDTDAQSATYTVSYKANDYAPSQVVEGSVLTGRTGVYTIVYNVTNKDSTNKEVEYKVYSKSGLSASETVNTGNNFIYVSDYIVDGVIKGVAIKSAENYAGVLFNKDSGIMKKFLSLPSDYGMRITVKNIDKNQAFEGKFYMNAAVNTNSQFLKLEVGEIGSVYFKNDGKYNEQVDHFEYWLTEAGFKGEIAMIVDFVKDSDYEVAMFDDLATNGTAIATAMTNSSTGGKNAPTVTYANNEFTIDAAGDRYVDLLALGSYSDKITKYYASVTAEQRRQQVLAVDVRMDADNASGKIWVGIGANSNNINYNGNTRDQLITSQWRTIYIHAGMTDTDYNAEVFNWVKLNVDSTKLRVRNIRVLNFAGIK